MNKSEFDEFMIVIKSKFGKSIMSLMVINKLGEDVLIKKKQIR